MDVEVERLDASNENWVGARLKRAAFIRCRMTGLSLVGAEIEDVRFQDCKLDLALFREAKVNRTVFEDCVFDDADWAGAWFKDTSFPGSQLRRIDLDGVRFTRADLRDCRFSELRGDVTVLRGTIVSPLQLIDLAPALADGLGITVRENEGTVP